MTDYTCMEALKKEPRLTFPKSMEILARHPDQVLVLKGTNEICSLSGRRSGLRRRMVSLEYTQHFKEFSSNYDKIAQGASDANIIENAKAATDHFNIISVHASVMLESIKNIAETCFTMAELKIIAEKKSYTDNIVRKILTMATDLSSGLFRSHPSGIKFPKPDTALNTFIFRYCLAGIILIIRWIEGGRQLRTKTEKVVNDLVDLNFAAYATFFNGILTDDDKQAYIYQETAFILKEIGADVLYDRYVP